MQAFLLRAALRADCVQMESINSLSVLVLSQQNPPFLPESE